MESVVGSNSAVDYSNCDEPLYEFVQCYSQRLHPGSAKAATEG